ncbi:hypothetical protein [Saccharothrix syringae]|nr:hypothetical protein [Saccharothrix syringae]
MTEEHNPARQPSTGDTAVDTLLPPSPGARAYQVYDRAPAHGRARR